MINNLSLSIAPGEWVCLLGPNGSGKSTLLDCVVGHKVPAAGSIVHIAGQLATTFSAKRQLGFGCAPEALPGLLTARQCLEIHAGAKRLGSLSDDLLRLADELRFSPYLDSFVDTLSLGTRQKLSILLALIGNPALIVLDEAFNGLDPSSALVLKRYLGNYLKTHHASLLLATHALDIVQHYADRAVLLIDGQIRREWQRVEIESLLASGLRFDEAFAASALE